MTQPENGTRTNLDERFAACERILRDLKQSIESTRTQRTTTPQEQRGAKVHELKNIVANRGRATVADVRQALGVSLKTANRVIHQCAYEDGGVLLYERAGNTMRLVLVRPSEDLAKAIARAQQGTN